MQMKNNKNRFWEAANDELDRYLDGYITWDELLEREKTLAGTYRGSIEIIAENDGLQYLVTGKGALWALNVDLGDSPKVRTSISKDFLHYNKL
jgi:hypothetical protein